MAAVNIEFPGNLAQVDSASELRRVPTVLLKADLLFLVVDLGGVYKFDSGSTATDDGTTVIRPNDRTPLQAGRWLFTVDGLAPGAPGPTGPANSSYSTLALMKAADPSKLSYILTTPNGPATYTYVTGDFTGRVDDVNVVALNSVPITTGALVGGLAAGANKPVTSRFVTNLDGAVINRLGDRVLVGGANKYDGNYPNDDPNYQDWYTAYERAQGRGNGIILSSQMAVLTNNYFGAAIGAVFAARTSNLGDSVGGAVGLEAHVVNDKTSFMHPAWALYSEATRDSDGVGAIITYEADSRNKGLYHPVTPWNQNDKQSVVHQIASGGALTGVGCEDVSAGINFRHNPTKFGAGIVFGYNSIRGTDGSIGSGYGNAIVFARRHRLTWMNSVDAEVSNLSSSVTVATFKNGLDFTDGGAVFTGPTDTATFLVSPVANSANYVVTTAGAAGIAPILAAAGSDTNVDLKLTAKGTGTIAIGNSSNFVAPGTGTPTWTNSLPAGIDPVPRKWLAIHGAAGEFYIIPCLGALGA